MTSSVLLAAVVLVLALPARASAVPLLEPADGAELAQTLAEATEEQDVCYGWAIEVVDDSGGPSGTDVGSSLGPGRRVDRTRCPRWVELVGTVTYTSETSESEDSADAGVVGNLPRTPTLADLEELGYPTDRLIDDDNDEALVDMVGALPLLVAAGGQAPYVPFEEATGPPPAADRPDPGPGSDWWRNYWWLVALTALGLGGLAVFFGAAVQRRRAWLAATRGARPRDRPGDAHGRDAAGSPPADDNGRGGA